MYVKSVLNLCALHIVFIHSNCCVTIHNFLARHSLDVHHYLVLTLKLAKFQEIRQWQFNNFFLANAIKEHKSRLYFFDPPYSTLPNYRSAISRAVRCKSRALLSDAEDWWWNCGTRDTNTILYTAIDFRCGFCEILCPDESEATPMGTCWLTYSHAAIRW